MERSQLPYHLPFSPTQRCLDRFSILADSEVFEDENGEVPIWQILQEVLSKMPVADGRQLVELLETIAITLRGSTGPAGDYGLLKEIVNDHDNKHFGNFFRSVWPKLKTVALKMPNLFKTAMLPVVGFPTDDLLLGQSTSRINAHISESRLTLPREQAASILAHQFLCTLSAPMPHRNEYFDFSIWYSSQQRHPEAAKIYLATLFKYFSDLPPQSDERPLKSGRDDVVYTLRTLVEDQASQQHRDSLPLSQISVDQVPEYDTTPKSLGLPRGAAVVSANKVIGFGESATQEEIHVGCSPEACPAVLFVPELQHNQVLVTRGARVVSNIVGQRRDIRLGDQQDSEADVDWSQRVMLFMDALELDMPEQYNGHDGASQHPSPALLPDLIPQNMEREIRKACLAFSSGEYEEIVSPLWGCGAFNGDPFVKVLLLWLAASTVQAPRPDTTPPALRVACDEGLREVAERLARVVELAKIRLNTVGDLRSLLCSVPKDVKRLETGQWLVQHLQGL